LIFQLCINKKDKKGPPRLGNKQKITLYLLPMEKVNYVFMKQYEYNRMDAVHFYCGNFSHVCKQRNFYYSAIIVTSFAPESKIKILIV
jgi:hypothetical protein